MPSARQAEPRVYLAGPDVFLPEPERRGATLRDICGRHGLAAVFPLDTLEGEPAGWQSLPEWERIARRNEAHIRSADALVANLTPFRGVSADAGTVFELGYMRALARPVFGWSNVALPFTERVCAALGGGSDGLAVEAFGRADNLMIDGAIAASGGALVVASPPEEALWTALDAFEECVRQCAALLLRSAARQPRAASAGG